MTIDVARCRAETRGCERVVHLNNAGASLMPAPVADALVDYLREEELCGGYETAAARKAELENFYTATARMLHCQPDEIAFVENATRAWDMVFYAFELRPGDRILTSRSEYASNMIAFLQRARHTGCTVEVIPVDHSGQVDCDALVAMIDERVRLIAVSHVPTGGGLVNPAADIGAVARHHCIPYLLDACQSVGHLPLDVEALGCDFLTGTGRKYLRGPRGTGLLYVRRAWIERLEPPMLDLHAAKLTACERYEVRGDARRFENWECNFAGKAALGRAIDYALALGLNAIRDRIYGLAGRLRDGLETLPGVTLTDEGVERCGIVTFTTQGLAAKDIMARAKADGINIETASPAGQWASFEARGLSDVVRASVHYFNTEGEVDRLIALVRSAGLPSR